MLIIRPLQENDLDDLHNMAASAGNGLTTLPPDRQLLEGKIRKARDTFEGRCQPDAGLYLFALEDTSLKRCVGISGIQARVGLNEVFYNYRLSITVRDSRELGVHVRTPTLYLTNDMTDSTEIGSLLLAESHRGGGNGLVLSRSRFLFLDEFRQHFSDKIFAEMRGVSDEAGQSPLWEALGRRFFDMDYVAADRLSARGNKSFIAELMPQFPIYLSLLPDSAREVIGEVHTNTRPALNMLQAEGFNFNGLVDIFDGGPVVEAFLHNIRTIRQSILRPVKRVDRPLLDNLSASDRVMVSNRAFEDFRVGTLPRQAIRDEEVQIPGPIMEALGVSEGDQVRLAPLKDPLF
ncbi:arginine N-succinyltransferase [Marinobacter daqiaonensis]|uniref:Arginine N-succinyltransferase n=1 Tax=Marinobacter daqiaonensis TaxID=650891 RepID=A0A1I6HU63_9GAMM|nr:arginine N-succinyltransferase [Marinobacter daqiaonensis]SFR57963.1 arginine N-succinyltransferase [Marinobacter daqiaonensis]